MNGKISNSARPYKMRLGDGTHLAVAVATKPQIFELIELYCKHEPYWGCGKFQVGR